MSENIYTLQIRRMMNILANFLCNVLTCIVNIFIKRDRTIMLMGAWSGQRWGGNSRYLFQYLSENREKYGLKRVVWVTRKKEICDELQELGYEAYMMHSVQSWYYHFKAGIHVISNNVKSSANRNPSVKKDEGDIMGRFSMGAVRVCLNHAIGSVVRGGMLYVDKLEGMERTVMGIYAMLHKNSFLKNFVLHAGGWGHHILLSTGNQSTQRIRALHMDSEEIIYLETGLPELCACLRCLKKEEQVINIVKKAQKTILFLPKYRISSEIEYIHPLNDVRVCDYLKQKGFLWIDKLHPWANDSMSASYYDPEISLKLSSDFDINLILRHVDVVITDYSTLSYKAIYFDRPLIYYWPDHEKYMKKDKGLVKEFENDIAGLITYEPSELMMALNKCLGDNYMEQWADKYAVIKENVFGGRISEYEDIARDLFECIKTKW